MESLAKISLAKKLTMLVVFFLAITVVLGGISIDQLRKVSDAQREMYSGTVVPLRMVVDGGRQAAVHFRRMYPYILKTDPKSREETFNLNEKTEADVLKAIDFLTKDAPTPELREVGRALSETWGRYKASTARLYAAANAGNADQAMEELRTVTDPVHVEVRNLLVKAGKLQEEFANSTTEAVATSVDRTAWTILVIIGFALILGGWIGTLLTRSVLGQLGGEPTSATEVASRIASGDLKTDVNVKPGDTRSLMYQLQTMRANLASLIQQVRDSAESVSSASSEIATGTSDLSGRTEQQASALEHTASSMEELGSTSRKNADNAHAANQLAINASVVAKQGGEVVQEVVETMRAINDASSKISDIIGVIDGIAFQTNILALNAAVEAARAGEQGRGFAVVASEVRALAQRSAGAAREIKTLISTSTERVAHGAALVDKAGSTMGDVVSAIHRVTDIVGEISVSSTEQNTGVVQISQSLSQMDSATQQNAALVEESAAAAESLKFQANQLVHAVSVFRL